MCRFNGKILYRNTFTVGPFVLSMCNNPCPRKIMTWKFCGYFFGKSSDHATTQKCIAFNDVCSPVHCRFRVNPIANNGQVCLPPNVTLHAQMHLKRTINYVIKDP